MVLMQQMAQNNPQAAQVLRLTQGKTSAQIEQMTRNMYRERGITPEQMLQHLGIFPSNNGVR